MDEQWLEIRSGRADNAEIAALVVALEEAASARPQAQVAPLPAWLRAARREALGWGPIAQPSDLQD